MVAKIAQFRYLSKFTAVNSDILFRIKSYIPIFLTKDYNLPSQKAVT